MTTPIPNEARRPRILISRMSAIGDSILTLPVVCALRERYPDAFLAWVVEKKAAPMVRGHECLDEVVELERGWFVSPSGIRATRRKLVDLNCDIAIDCQGMTKSSFACWLSGAKRRIGYAGKHSRELSGWFNNEKVETVFSHLTDRSLELLSPLGIHCPEVRWNLPLPNVARVWSERYRRTIAKQRLAILNPGATWHSKRWEMDRFGAVARHLRDNHDYACVVIWGNDLDRELADRIIESSDGAAVLAPPTDLQHLAALIQTGDLFISGDTGPLHMAVAVGARTIGLYGATRPGDCGPYRQTALQNAYETGSSKHRRQADNSAMRAISVSDVCAVVDQWHEQEAMYQRAG